MRPLDKHEPDPTSGSTGTSPVIGRVLVASAPVRTADLGGWTDTWFARSGVVCSIALDERAEVHLAHDPAAGGVVLAVELTGERYRVAPDALPGHHPMLERAIATIPPPPGTVVTIGNGLPPGLGLGGSASVMVALVAGLAAVRGEQLAPIEVVRIAHRCEVDAGREAGVQDHAAAAFGGVSALEVRYPDVERTEVVLSPAAVEALGRRLITVSFGAAHSSSAMHDEVIARLAAETTPPALERIRVAARTAIRALRSGDLDGYGRALTDNHEAIRSMHPGTISAEADELAALARTHGASGWKVNGAGGVGGSMVVLGPEDVGGCAALSAAIAARHPWHLVRAGIARDGVRIRWIGTNGPPP